MCTPGGVILDLTCVPPAAAVEAGGRFLGRLDQDAFLADAAVTERAVDRLVAEGLLVEEARLPHDVRKHYGSGADLIEDIAERRRADLSPALHDVLVEVREPVIERTSCLLRRLRVPASGRRRARVARTPSPLPMACGDDLPSVPNPGSTHRHRQDPHAT
jgi:hypothetical protein